MADTFEKALGINPVVKTIETVPEILPPEEKEEVVEDVLSKDAKEDYDLSRNTFKTLINKGSEAVEGITELAKMSESPEAYKALAALMKTVSDTTKDLFDLQKKSKELKGIGSDSGKKILDTGNVNIDKAVFVGTTTELLKSLKKQDEK
jgi:hypothetical protein